MPKIAEVVSGKTGNRSPSADLTARKLGTEYVVTGKLDASSEDQIGMKVPGHEVRD